jgi:hypothetical protein
MTVSLNPTPNSFSREANENKGTVKPEKRGSNKAARTPPRQAACLNTRIVFGLSLSPAPKPRQHQRRNPALQRANHPLHSQPSKPDVLMAPARRALWLASASLNPSALVAGCIGEVAKRGGFRHGGAVVSLRELLGGGAGREGVVVVSWWYGTWGFSPNAYLYLPTTTTKFCCVVLCCVVTCHGKERQPPSTCPSCARSAALCCLRLR